MAFALFLLVNSCKKDNSQVLTKLDTQEIMQSSTFYQESLKATVDNRFSKMQPNWEQAKITQDSSQLVYELELTNPDQVFIGTSEVKVSNAKSAAGKNVIRLLLFKEAATGKILNGCYMSIMSDDQDERISSFSYKKMNGFNGKVLYYHLDGSIANGWVYKSGNIIASISRAEKQTPIKILNKSLSTNRNGVSGKTMTKQIQDPDCITESFPYYNYQCFDVVGYVKCNWVVAGYDQVTTCYFPGGGGGGPCIGCTGGGGYTPPVRDCAGKINGTASDQNPCGLCIGGTTGITECPVFNPCDEKLKIEAQESNANLTAIKNAILAKTDGNEWGAKYALNSLSMTSGYKPATLQTNGLPDRVDVDFSWNSSEGYSIGFVHNHPGIENAPSIDDVLVLYQNSLDPELAAAGDQAFYKANSSLTVVTNSVKYVVKITNWANMAGKYIAYTNNTNGVQQTLNGIRNSLKSEFSYTEREASEAILLIFLEGSIDLFKAAPNSTTFKPLTFNTTDYTLSLTNCP